MLLETTVGKRSSLGKLEKAISGRVGRRPNGLRAVGDYKLPGGNELNITGPCQVEIDGNANSDVYEEYPELELAVTLIEAVSEKKIVLSGIFKKQRTKENELVWVWPNEELPPP
jgi:hypothetical protein